MKHWLGAARDAIEAEKPAVLVSILRHPTLLPVPVGPVCVVDSQQVNGALHFGTARGSVLDACSLRLASPSAEPQTLGLTLNPWAGEHLGHVAQVQLRNLSAADAPALAALHDRLGVGRAGGLDLRGNTLSFGDADGRDTLPLGPQAMCVESGVAQFNPPTDTAFILGAGVLAHRLVESLAETPLRVAWLPLGSPVSLDVCPANLVLLQGADCVPGEAALPAGCHALVMTHDHDLDIDLCHRLLVQGQLASLGMVGSRNKRSRLNDELAARGLSEAEISGVRCPLGGGNHANLEHASVAIAAELLAGL